MAVKTRQTVPSFNAQRLEAIVKVLADTDDGLTGSQIGYLLMDCEIPDTDPSNTKWKRLFNAFISFQNDHQVGNHVVVFINRAMNPANYTENRTVYQLRRDRLNTVLAFSGLYIGEDGRVRHASRASTLDEATKRASRLRGSLLQRNVHADVLSCCNSELLEENYFHAVFEAMKSVTKKLRDLSGSTSDGADLIHFVFGMRDGDPRFAISSLDTESLRGEQRGFVSLLKGLYGTIRNPLAHNTKMEWDVEEQDALDIMTTISLVHRKLDSAKSYLP